MSVLKFNGYVVDNLLYQRNENFNSKKGEVHLKPQINVNNEINEENIIVHLKVSVGDLDQSSIPFKVEVAISGSFQFDSSADDQDLGIDTFIRNNAVAILYPYARTLLANLTLSSNEYPSFTLPTINVSKALDAEKK